MPGAGAKESQVGACRVRFSQRQSVLVVEPLTALTASDLPALSRSIAQHARTAQTQRTLLDLRWSASTVLSVDAVEEAAAAGRASGPSLRDALTRWAVAEEAPLVLVVGDELHVAEINMASLASGALVRAFSSTADAFRHAARPTTRGPSERGPSEAKSSTRASPRPGLGSDERRALLFPRRASEVGFVRAPGEPSDAEG